MFDPKPTRYPFPEITDRHYLKLKKDRGIAIDRNYPFVDESPFFLFKRAVSRAIVFLLGYAVCTVRMGLIIRRKKYRGLLSGGFVSVSNHVHMWDFLAIMKALYFRKPAVLAWDRNINGENGTIIRLVGGIPIPVCDVRATIVFKRAVNDYLKKGNWLHIAAEGSMWEFYKPIRPFKRGPFQIAYNAGVPVLPIGFSYREPKGIWKLFYKQAFLTLTIGEPLYFREDLPPFEAVEDMTIRAHRAVCRLCGIEPEENLYPPVFRNNHRIDYYTDEYGVPENKARKATEKREKMA